MKETTSDTLALFARQDGQNQPKWFNMTALANNDLSIKSDDLSIKSWVGLTDEEMNEAMDYWSDDSRSAYGGASAADGEYVDMISTWRYIEAKLKEKNT